VYKTNMILIEGIPGSGKSTMAHFLTRQLDQQGIIYKWWYEEEKWHPLYLFEDADSLEQLFAALAAGHYREIIQATLGKWQELASNLRDTEYVILFDSSLFGYLTWTLFPFGVPIVDIQAYLAQIAGIIYELNPCLIYFHQQDIAANFQRIFARRGGETEVQQIQKVTQSPYAQKYNLQGFTGLVTFWRDYQALTDIAFANLPFVKLALDTTAGEWASYQRQVLDILELPGVAEPFLSPEEQERFVGKYAYQDGEQTEVCTIVRGNDQLFLDDAPQVWAHTRLIPVEHNHFMVESLPFEVQFIEDANGAIYSMRLIGPEQLFGAVDYILWPLEETA
jgi:thymidylate kinase